MTQPLKLTIKSSVLDRHRELIIDTDYLEFDDNDIISEPLTRFTKPEIQQLRYGVKWIKGYAFVIGRVYCIDIQNNQGKIIKIRLKSLYGIRKQQLTEKYVNIVNTLYDNFFDEISGSYVEKFNAGEDFRLLGITFNQDGIIIDPKFGLTPWDDINTRSYQTYYTISVKSKPGNYKAFEFLNDWNTGILYSVSRQILKDKNLYSEE